MNGSSLRSANLAFRFILELVVLAALLLWGFSSSDNLLVQLVLGIGAVGIAIAIWGTYVAPKAPRRLADPMRVAVEVIVFGAGALAFVASGYLVLGILLAASAAMSIVLMFAWGQRGF